MGWPESQLGEEFASVANDESNLPSVMYCTAMAGRAVIRVVARCNDAQETCNLDLSECQLMQIPDAVYHLMRNTDVQTFDLSANDLTKIGPGLAKKFSNITSLNLSRNKISTLPDQLSDLTQLRSLEVAHNNLTQVPPAATQMPALETLDVSNNRIDNVDVEVLKGAPSLRVVNLSNNPLTLPCRAALEAAFHIVSEPVDNCSQLQVVMSTPEDDDDWKIDE